MNKVKFVAADARARELGKLEVMVMEVEQRKRSFFGKPLFRMFTRLRKPTLPEATILARERGWIRLSALPPSERRKYRAATATRS